MGILEAALVFSGLSRGYTLSEGITSMPMCFQIIPHWAGELRAFRLEMEEATKPIRDTPFGARMLAAAARVEGVEAGLRGMGGTHVREELAELKHAFADHMAAAAKTESDLRLQIQQLKDASTANAFPRGSNAEASCDANGSLVAGDGAVDSAGAAEAPVPDSPLLGRPLVVGVAGPSGSGKSTLAAALAEALGGAYVAEGTDHFLLPRVPYAERDERYESPSNIDWAEAHIALADAIGAEVAGRVVVVEHFLLLAEESSLLPLLDRCIFLDPQLALAPDSAREFCRERRAARSERSAEEAAAMRRYYDGAVWPNYLRYTHARRALALAPENVAILDPTKDAASVRDEATQQCMEWLRTLPNTEMLGQRKPNL